MTNSQQPEPERPARRRRRWVGVGLTVGSVLVLAGAGAAWWGWVFLNERFSPWASAELSKALKRPVNVGDIERITPSSIRVGISSIPTIPLDPDALSVEAVEVRFNLFDLLRREVNLDIVLENVEGYFEQNAELEWIDIDFANLQRDRGREPIIQVRPSVIRLSRSKLNLVPYSDPGLPRQQVGLENVQANIDFLNPDVEVRAGTAEPQVQAQQINFEASADSVVRGEIAISGSILLPPPPEEAGEAQGTLPPDLPRAVYPLLAASDRLDTFLDKLGSLANAGLGGVAIAQDEAPDGETSDAEASDVEPEGQDPTPEGGQEQPDDAPRDRRINLNIRAQNAQATEISAIVLSLFERKPPISITGGNVSGSVDIDVLPEQPLSVRGTARFNEGVVVARGLPTPFEDISGLARFQGQVVAFESLVASLGEVSATADGTIDFNRGYALAGQVNPFTLTQLQELFKFSLPVPVSGVFAGTINLTGPLKDPNIAVNVISQGAARLDRVDFAALGADITLDPEALVIDSFRALPAAGGELTGSGRYTLDRPATLTLTAQGRDLPVDALGRPYGLPETITIGPAFLEAGLSGPVDRLQGAISWRAPAGEYPARGDIEIAGNALRFRDTFVQVAGGTVNGDGVLVDGNWNASLQARGVQLARLNPRAQGVASGSFELAGNLRQRGLSSIRGQGSADVALASGSIRGVGSLANGSWNTSLQAREVALNQFLPNASGAASGSFQLAGSLDNLTLQGIRGQGGGSLALAGGTLNAQGQLANGAWNANVRGQDVQLSQFSNNLQGTAGGRFNLSGNLDSLSLAAIRGEGDFVVSDGLAAAAPQFPQLAAVRQPLTGTLAWNGSQIQVQQASTAGLQVSGTLTPLLTGPNGPTLSNIDLALEAQDFNLAALPFPNQVPVTGLASFDGRLSGSPRNLSLVGDARLVNLAVSDLQFEPLLAGPVNFTNGGLVDVALRGVNDRIDVDYGFSDRNLAFDIRAGESSAIGGITNNILRADIARFPLEVLNLPPGGIAGLGTVRGTVETASLTGDVSRSTLSGSFDISDPGLGYINLDRFRGQIAYADRALVLTGGSLSVNEGEYLVTGRFSQRNEPQLVAQITAQNAELQDVLTTLQFFELEDLQRGLRRPQWFRDYTPEEVARALPVRPAGGANASLWDQLRRLSELLELEDAIAEREEAAPLPPLGELAGRFSGDISISGSLPNDLNVGFDLVGQNWTWGDNYEVDQVLAEGRYADGVLRLNPVRFASITDTTTGESAQSAFLTLNGEIALNPSDTTPRTLSADLKNVPLSSLRQPLRLPDSVAGRLNADATLTGSLANPQVRGIFSVEDARINGNPLQSARAGFLYQDARLNLESALLVSSSDDPLTLSASVPYRLPFAEQRPLSSDLAIDVNVRDEGIALLNLFTRAVTWESGRGAVNLTVRGRWEDGQVPDIQTLAGYANFDEATVRAQVLPEPLTNLNGALQFAGDRIIVDRLVGQFSQGQLQARGALPLLNPLVSNFPSGATPPALNLQPEPQPTAPGSTPSTPQPVLTEIASLPLTVDAENIRLNFKGIYNGNVEGRIQVGGSVFLYGPLVTGQVVLSEGRLSLPDTTLNDGNVVQAGIVSERQGRFQVPPPAFDDLDVLLTDDVRVVVGGIVDVAAQGGISVNGIYPALRPEGRIRLPSGRISLVTTDFRLTGDENYAEFRPNLGLEPYLRASLRAAVPASAGGSTTLIQASPFPRNEVADVSGTRLGLNQSGIETIRIRAEVDGPASQVAQLRGVTLTSTPSRSESEIVSLISGGFFTALESTLGSVGGSGDSFQGLIALAGTALLNNIQDLLGNALNITELRLFTAAPVGAQGSASSIDFGGEIGFALTPTISLSVQKVFTNVTPAQFNVRYRINDQLQLRGTTSYENFRENSGLLLEYESRF